MGNLGWKTPGRSSPSRMGFHFNSTEIERNPDLNRPLRCLPSGNVLSHQLPEATLFRPAKTRFVPFSPITQKPLRPGGQLTFRKTSVSSTYHNQHHGVSHPVGPKSFRLLPPLIPFSGSTPEPGNGMYLPAPALCLKNEAIPTLKICRNLPRDIGTVRARTEYHPAEKKPLRKPMIRSVASLSGRTFQGFPPVFAR